MKKMSFILTFLEKSKTSKMKSLTGRRQRQKESESTERELAKAKTKTYMS
jgi:hypothetical protein